MMRFAAVALVVGSLVAMTYSGVGGISPIDGVYGMVRTSSDPDEKLADGTFGTSGSNKTLQVNPYGGGGTSSWTKGSDGQYTRDGGSGAQSICVHAIASGGYSYEEKLFGFVESYGVLNQ